MIMNLKTSLPHNGKYPFLLNLATDSANLVALL
jgi:hypothetical protein